MSASDGARVTVPVLGAPIDVLAWPTAVARVMRWAQARESRYVCICNAHSVVTAEQDAAFARVVAEADMATPDGAPVAWMLRRLGHRAQERISGPDLMLHVCERAAADGVPIGLVGATDPTLALLCKALQGRWPALQIAVAIAPPFRPLSMAEDDALAARVNASGAAIVWVGLGCPKQELWMAAQRGRIDAVMLGVGAAFDFHAGTTARAPAWMREHGLEWLHRLASEPQRLWRRYLFTNTAFVLGAGRQLLRRRR